jgi:hypothetical protein
MSSQEVLRPSVVTGLKADLVEAVTNAYMAKRVPELTGLKFDHGGCQDGEFRYKSPSADNVFGFSLESDVGYYCSYPGGVWREDETFAPDSEKSSDDSTYGTGDLFDAKGTYAMIESEVSSWIDPWGDCHSPNEFANQINSIANVAAQLYVGNEIVFGGQDVSPVDSDGSVSSAVSDVRSAIDEVKVNTDDMRGLAIDAFQRTYVLDIERTLGGQRGLATAAGLAVTAEATAWNETYLSLRDFIEKAIHDFNDYAGTHGGVERPPRRRWAPCRRSPVWPVPRRAWPSRPSAWRWVWSGESPPSAPRCSLPPPPSAPRRWPSAVTTTWATGRRSRTASRRSTPTSRPPRTPSPRGAVECSPTTTPTPTTTIARGSRSGQQGPEDDAAPFLQSQVDFNHTKMRFIAGAVESIGDHQRGLAGRLGGVDGAGNPSSLVQSEWGRASLPEVGVMGNGPSGPYDAFAQVVDQLTDLLLIEARTAHRLAEHCIAVSRDFRATDDQREAELDSIAGQFDTVAIPVVNRDG